MRAGPSEPETEKRIHSSALMATHGMQEDCCIAGFRNCNSSCK